MARYLGQSAQHQRRQRRVIIFGIALASLLSLATGVYLGHRYAYGEMGIDPKVYQQMQEQLPAASENIEALSAELEVQRTRHAVDREALEMVRREIAVQKRQVVELDEELRFYKGLMAPDDVEQGLSLRAVELTKLEAAGRYAIRIVIQQEARKHQLVKGRLAIQVLGERDGERLSYPIGDLSEDVDDAVLLLRFRYFQSVEGELVLPEGFEPTAVSVVAAASTPRKSEVRVEFPWRVQERFTHVGK